MNTPVTIIVLLITLSLKIITDLIISIVIDMINHHFSLEKEVSHTPHMYTVG